MLIQNSEHLLQRIDNGGSISLDNRGQLQEQNGFVRFCQNIGDAFRRWSASGRATIDERNTQLGNAMHAMVARDNPLPNLAQEALPRGGALSTGGRNMLVRMEIGRQLSNFPSDARPGVSQALQAICRTLGRMSSTGILQFIEQKVKELNTTPAGRLFIHNQAIIQKMNTGNEAVTEAITRGKTKALDILGGLGTLDTHDFTQDMQTKIASSPTKVSPQMLEDMGERAGRETLVKSLILGLINNADVDETLKPEEKTALLGDLMQSPHAEALVNASTPESAKDLAVNMRRNVFSDIMINIACQALKHELLNTGLKEFCDKTGLSEEEGKRLNISSLENKMDMRRSISKFYADDRRRLKEMWETKSKKFFDNRAAAYNSIAGLPVPQANKEAWLTCCLNTKEKIQSDTFTLCAGLAHNVSPKEPMLILTDSRLTVPQKLDAINEIVKELEEQWIAAFGEDRIKSMGADGQQFTSSLIGEAVAHFVLASGHPVPSQNEATELKTAALDRSTQFMGIMNPNDPKDVDKIRHINVTSAYVHMWLEQSA